MASNQFFGNDFCHRIEIKPALFAGHLSVQDDLQQKIAQFFLHFLIVHVVDGIDQFITFFDDVRLKRLMRLLPIPRTSIRRTQPLDDLL